MSGEHEATTTRFTRPSRMSALDQLLARVRAHELVVARDRSPGSAAAKPTTSSTSTSQAMLWPQWPRTRRPSRAAPPASGLRQAWT